MTSRAVLLAVVLAFGGVAANEARAQGAPPAPVKVQVAGNAENKLELGIEDLRRLAVQQVRMGTSKESEQTRHYTGVLLRDVISSAKPIEKERHDLRRSIVVVTAADGYEAVSSWAELFVSPIGEGVLVIFQRDGAPLPASEGPLALVSLRDTQSGPRHVKWLQKIEIRRIGD